MVQIYKGNDHNVRKQIGDEIDTAIASTTALAVRVSAIEAAPVVTGSATGAFSAELVLTAGANATVTVGAGTATVNAGYPVFVQAIEIAAPSSAVPVYFGNCPREPTSTADISRVYFPKSGTIKRADIIAYIGGPGSSENWTLEIRLNNTTNTTIANSGSAGNLNRFTNTGLSIAVTTSDYIEIKVTFPAWLTAPTAVAFAGALHVE